MDIDPEAADGGSMAVVGCDMADMGRPALAMAATAATAVVPDIMGVGDRAEDSPLIWSVMKGKKNKVSEANVCYY